MSESHPTSECSIEKNSVAITTTRQNNVTSSIHDSRAEWSAVDEDTTVESRQFVSQWFKKSVSLSMVNTISSVSPLMQDCNGSLGQDFFNFCTEHTGGSGGLDAENILVGGEEMQRCCKELIIGKGEESTDKWLVNFGSLSTIELPLIIRLMLVGSSAITVSVKGLSNHANNWVLR